MYKDNFKIYSTREVKIFKHFVDNNAWFENQLEDFKPDNTSLHDLKCKMKDGKTLIIQIKEDEAYWYNRTKNIGLDYISAFNFLRNKSQWLNNNYWIKSSDYQNFIGDVSIGKWGKLITCDADVHLFYVEGCVCHLYNNSALQASAFIHHLNSSVNLRINKKSDYNLGDEWESAAYFLPVTNANVSRALISDYTSLLTAIQNNTHTVNRNF